MPKGAIDNAIAPFFGQNIGPHIAPPVISLTSPDRVRYCNMMKQFMRLRLNQANQPPEPAKILIHLYLTS
jgi:hypothetical protein